MSTLPGVGVEDGVVSVGSPYPESVMSVPLGVAVGVGVGVDEGDVVSGSSPHSSTSVGVGVAVAGVYGGGTTDAGTDGVPDDVGVVTGVDGSTLGLPDDVGRELVVGELPGVVVAFPVTNCAASAQNATNRLTCMRGCVTYD